jgi:Fe2+ transport system protein FeoA
MRQLPAAERLRGRALPVLRLQQRAGSDTGSMDSGLVHETIRGVACLTGGSMIMTLADLQPGQCARVLGLKDPALTKQQVRKYLAMGLVPGVEITLVQRFPAYVFEMGYSQFALDRELASEVLVRVEGSKHDDA